VSSDTETPRRFYAERLPEQFNRTLREQERRVEAAQRLLEGMRAVDATIRIEVRGEGGGTFFLNVAKGVMSAGDSPAHPPFLAVIQDRAAFERLAREAGDSALGMLGGLSGLAGEMKLTKARIENLAGVRGSLRFEVTGADGFALLTHFGDGPVPDPPTTTIRVDPETYAALRGGALDPQQAFMSGRIQVEGDMQLAMQLALAALSPD
jgi:hypothetical protein